MYRERERESTFFYQFNIPPNIISAISLSKMCSFRMSDNNKNSENTKFLDPVEKKEEIIDGPENAPGSESGSSIEEEKKETGKLLECTSCKIADKSGRQLIIDTAAGDDDEGFRTPMSPEHRIPAITECPPAPRKPQPSRLKRRRSSGAAARRCLEFDSLEEVESVFRPAVPDVENEPAIKKARRDDDDDDDHEKENGIIN